jgi:LPXTG-motif cell wall-anchored protein
VEITAEVTLKPVNKIIVSTSAVEIINAKIPKGPPGSPPPFITPPAFTTPTVITPPGVNPPGEPPIDVDGDIPAGGDVLLPDSGLPKTGGTSRANIYFTGGLLILLGIMLRRKTA